MLKYQKLLESLIQILSISKKHVNNTYLPKFFFMYVYIQGFAFLYHEQKEVEKKTIHASFYINYLKRNQQ